jgi:hypothetical protein
MTAHGSVFHHAVHVLEKLNFERRPDAGAHPRLTIAWDPTNITAITEAVTIGRSPDLRRAEAQRAPDHRFVCQVSGGRPVQTPGAGVRSSVRLGRRATHVPRHHGSAQPALVQWPALHRGLPTSRPIRTTSTCAGNAQLLATAGLLRNPSSGPMAGDGMKTRLST